MRADFSCGIPLRRYLCAAPVSDKNAIHYHVLIEGWAARGSAARLIGFCAGRWADFL
jgi:hypothetical protein